MDTVFLSYSVLDAALVHNVLARELEADRQRVCLQHRDLRDPVTPSQVHKVMQSAKKTIIVLSNNYLRTEQHCPGPEHSVIWVLLGGHQDQLAMLSQPGLQRAASVLQWGEPQFWAKLRYLLPVTCRQRESHYYSTCQWPNNKDHNVISHI